VTAGKVRTVRLGRPPSTDSAGTRQRILDTARLSFATRGYGAATNRSLGAEANLTAGAIYHYFGSKLDLYLAVYDDVQGRVYSRFDAAVEGPTTFRGKIDAVLDASFEMNRDDPTLAQFLGSVRVDSRRDAELRGALAPIASRRSAYFDRIIRVGVRTGEIRKADRARVSALVQTLLIGLTDAMSGDLVQHRLAIDAIKAVLDGTLLQPAE
jgi:AcrR family transcriptional regulator